MRPTSPADPTNRGIGRPNCVGGGSSSALATRRGQRDSGFRSSAFYSLLPPFQVPKDRRTNELTQLYLIALLVKFCYGSVDDGAYPSSIPSVSEYFCLSGSIPPFPLFFCTNPLFPPAPCILLYRSTSHNSILSSLISPSVLLPNPKRDRSRGPPDLRKKKGKGRALPKRRSVARSEAAAPKPWVPTRDGDPRRTNMPPRGGSIDRLRLVAPLKRRQEAYPDMPVVGPPPPPPPDRTVSIAWPPTI